MIRPDFREVKHSELYHFGVSKRNGAPGPGSGRYPLGSGDRPFQSGDLSEKEKKKISKEYEKSSVKASQEYAKNGQKLYMKAYNNAADYMNKGGIESFNREQQKKYGDNFAERNEYYDDYTELFNKIFEEEYAKVNIDFIENNKYFKMAEKIASEYKMEDWDFRAKDNTEYIKELRRLANQIDGR